MKLIMWSAVFSCLMYASDVELDKLPINKIQVIGSHNSFKLRIEPDLFKLIKQQDSVIARGIDYSHIALSDQLSLGLRNLEIDVFADAEGGRYASPSGLTWAEPKQPYDTDGVMKEPGFKVLHIQEIDFRSSCLTFKNCLRELRQWSEAHSDHSPVFITMNARDAVVNKPGFKAPEKFTSQVFDELDRTIITNLGREKILTPDDVRAKASTLEGRILKKGWPAVKSCRGKFVFILDETGPKLSMYVQGHSSLKGRVLFVNAAPGSPEAAFMILNDPVADSNKIREMVMKGYIVRTRADADTKEARNNDMSRFKAACLSGAQIITTDYYQKSTHFKSDYVVQFNDGSFVRRNPVFK